MNTTFHDDAMLDDAMLVDALSAIEYMNGLSKEAIGSSGTIDTASKADMESPTNSFLMTNSMANVIMTEANRTECSLPEELKLEIPLVADLNTNSESLIPPLNASSALETKKSHTEESKELKPNGNGNPTFGVTKNEKKASPYMQIIVTKESGLLGFGVLPVKGVCGIQVSTLQPDSSAAKAGLRVGDVLLKLDTTDVSNMHMPSIIQILQSVMPGKPLHISLFRPSIAVPMTAPLLTNAKNASSTLNRSANGGADSQLSKKPRTQPNETNFKKHIDTLTKELQVAKTENEKLVEKNGVLRKKVQQMVITSDEKQVKLKLEFDQKVARLSQEKQALQTTLSSLQAQARLDNRSVFDVSVTAEMKSQLGALQQQVMQYEELDKKRRELRKLHQQTESKLGDKYRQNLLQLIVTKVSSELKSISQIKSSASLRNNAFGSNSTTSPTIVPVHVKIQIDLVRRVAVHRLFNIHMPNDSLGYPPLSPLHIQLNENQLLDIFGKQLMCEERAGLNIIAMSPIDINYDPSTENFTLQCKWSEQNVIREIARSIRM